MILFLFLKIELVFHLFSPLFFHKKNAQGDDDDDDEEEEEEEEAARIFLWKKTRGQSYIRCTLPFPRSLARSRSPSPVVTGETVCSSPQCDNPVIVDSPVVRTPPMHAVRAPQESHRDS